MTTSSENKWVISDGEEEDEELGLYAKELFAYIKTRAEPAPVTNSQSIGSDQWYTANEEFASQGSSQVTLRENNTEISVTSKKRNALNDLQNDSTELDKEMVSNQHNSETNIRSNVYLQSRTVHKEDDFEGLITDDEENSITKDNSRSCNGHKNMISDEEDNSDKDVRETISDITPKVRYSIVCINEDEKSEEVNRRQDNRRNPIIYEDEEDDTEEMTRYKVNQNPSIVYIDEGEDSRDIIRPAGSRRCPIQHYDKDEGSDVIIIDDKDDTEENSENEASGGRAERAPKKSKFAKPFSTKVAKNNWWEQFGKPVSENKQCKSEECTFAPHPHEKHEIRERSFSTYETRLILTYLIHHKLIKYGKGIQIWEVFREQGYLTHRSADSLNNHFKRYILRDIQSYKLPKDIEDQFLKLWASNRKY